MAGTALRRPVGHEDRLSLVEHLDELRSRLIISAVALVAAFCVCFAFNGKLLDIVNRPLEHETQKNVTKGRGPLGETFKVEQGVRAVGTQLEGTLGQLAKPGSGLNAATRRALAAQRPALRAQLAQLPKINGNKPVTLGIGEPFTNTMIVSLYFAVLLATPLPGTDPVSMIVESLMLYVLYEVGILLSTFMVRPREPAAVTDDVTVSSGS